MEISRVAEASDYELLEKLGEKEALLTEGSDYLTVGRKKEIARELNHIIFEVDYRNKQDRTTTESYHTL